MVWLKIVLIAIAVLAGLWVTGRLAFPVPSVKGRIQQFAIPFDETTTLGPRAVEALAAHPGQSGVVPLADGQGALIARLQLAAGSERSIDAMYYIWHQDETGVLLLDTLRDAAARGVRVRLLLDDNGIDGMDQTLAALNAMPNFSVRLFNPSTIRNPKLAGYALSPLRMNRRMHNKAFIVDGAVAIVGGRNIGNEYFSFGSEPAYLDLDVLGVGDVVSDTAAVFDEYWNSIPAIELERVIDGPGGLAAFDAALIDALESDGARALAADNEQGPAARMAHGNAPPMEWTRVRVVADDPAKGTGEFRRSQLMITRLGRILGEVETRLDLISAYFVPAKQGMRFFADLAARGVEVNILTNSWEATDVPMVHAGYVKYRRELLEAGVSLYELKPIAGVAQGHDELGPVGSSGSSLHAKTFAADGARIFIGSFNFDPRSASLNCEMGFLIESPQMAENGSASMMSDITKRSFQPVLQGGKMVWKDPQADGSVRVIQHEPGLGIGNRIVVYVLNVLPIEWLL